MKETVQGWTQWPPEPAHHPRAGKLPARSGLAGPLQIRVSWLPGADDLTRNSGRDEDRQVTGSPPWWGSS